MDDFLKSLYYFEPSMESSAIHFLSCALDKDYGIKADKNG